LRGYAEAFAASSDPTSYFLEESPVIARGAASIVLAGALLLGTTGCTLFAVQATNIVYQPSDGTAGTVGDVKFLNVIALTADGRDVALVFSAVNTGDTSVTVTLQTTDASGATVKDNVSIPANSTMAIGDPGVAQIIVRDANATIGGLLPVYAQYGNNEGVQMMVPVLDGSTLSQYINLLPTPRPIGLDATPTPSATN